MMWLPLKLTGSLPPWHPTALQAHCPEIVVFVPFLSRELYGRQYVLHTCSAADAPRRDESRRIGACVNKGLSHPSCFHLGSYSADLLQLFLQQVEVTFFVVCATRHC
jgi:hypothetical protein